MEKFQRMVNCIIWITNTTGESTTNRNKRSIDSFTKYRETRKWIPSSNLLSVQLPLSLPHWGFVSVGGSVDRSTDRQTDSEGGKKLVNWPYPLKLIVYFANSYLILFAKTLQRPIDTPLVPLIRHPFYGLHKRIAASSDARTTHHLANITTIFKALVVKYWTGAARWSWSTINDQSLLYSIPISPK